MRRRRPARQGPGTRSARPGFTIVEIVLALVLLSFVVLAFQAATGQVIRVSADSDRRLVAVHLVDDRLAVVRTDPDYAGLEARYGGVEAEVRGFPGLRRTTRIRHTRTETETGVLDYKHITVSVTGPGLAEPVARTIVIAAP